MKRVPAFFLLAVLCLGISVLARPGVKPATKGSLSGKTVTLTNVQFTPKSITIKAGTTVTWVNKEGTHTVTADDGSWESPTLKAGENFSHQFDKPGTYRYHCSFHGKPGGGMAGSVRVIG